MSKIKIRNLPGLKFTDVLRRRKMTLKQYMSEFGITTYEGLSARCMRMGVVIPTPEEFNAARPTMVNSPAEGVVVLDPPPVIKESSGRKIDPETGDELPEAALFAVVTEPGEAERILGADKPRGELVGPTDGLQRKSRKKKVGALDGNE